MHAKVSKPQFESFYAPQWHIGLLVKGKKFQKIGMLTWHSVFSEMVLLFSVFFFVYLPIEYHKKKKKRN
jgi:hypothetical protein